jgi:hypothetical protein
MVDRQGMQANKKPCQCEERTFTKAAVLPGMFGRPEFVLGAAPGCRVPNTGVMPLERCHEVARWAAL